MGGGARLSGAVGRCFGVRGGAAGRAARRGATLGAGPPETRPPATVRPLYGRQ